MSCRHLYANVSCIFFTTLQSSEIRTEAKCTLRFDATSTVRTRPVKFIIQLSHNAKVALETTTTTVTSEHYSASCLRSTQLCCNRNSRSTSKKITRKPVRLRVVRPILKTYVTISTSKTIATHIENFLLDHWIITLESPTYHLTNDVLQSVGKTFASACG